MFAVPASSLSSGPFCQTLPPMVELVLRALLHLIEGKAKVIISRFLPGTKKLPL
jgi:hypothetical protein